MIQQLDRRRREGTLRTLLPTEELLSERFRSTVDFSSNDYLGLARCPHQLNLVHDSYLKWTNEAPHQAFLGATGSRLLSGDNLGVRRLEQDLAEIHQAEGALISNSGYDANLSVLSSVPVEGDVVIMDELVHNSLVMGVRMSRLSSDSVHRFRHNDVNHLRDLLRQVSTPRQQILVVVESVYSMDGDVAPLAKILDVAYEYNARVVVDEAHGLGVYGRTNMMDLKLPEEQKVATARKSRIDSGTPLLGGTGVLAALGLEAHPSLLCSVFTFGKAAGCHGAVICGSRTFLEYLINYARPLIYSTALPTHSLLSIECAYKRMTQGGDALRERVFELVKLFRSQILTVLSNNGTKSDNPSPAVSLWLSPSPIQALVVPGNDACVAFCHSVRNKGGIVLYPIRSPTVPRGKERVRIILHAHNTPDDVLRLVRILVDTMKEMDLISPYSKL